MRRFPSRPLARLRGGVLGLSLLLAGCGGGGGGGGSAPPPPLPGCANGTGTPITVSGDVRYQRLVLSSGGVGPATQLRPARFVDVEVLSADGTVCYGRTSSDAAGSYALVVAPPDGSTIQVRAYSRTSEDPTRDYTVHEADPPFSDSHDPNNAFSWSIGGITAMGSPVVDVLVPYNLGNRPSIGFAVLDTMVTVLDQVAAALGSDAGDAHAYTRVGNNGALGGVSFYRPGANALAILGGAAGNLDNSDTDYFDDAVVAHETCHYVENAFSHTMSRGGPHGSQPLEPAFAFSEGQATGLGNLMLGHPVYTDSTSTDGGVFFTISAENVTGASDPDGIGGEFTVAEIIWDLGDGGLGPTDTDGDAVAAPLGDILDAMFTLEPTQDAPYIGLFLDRVVAGSASVSQPQVTALLLAPEDQGIGYPLAGDDVWPIPIAIGGNHSGTLDSLATGTGFKNQCRGITSSAWYRLDIASSTTVTIDLAITPIAGSGNNLDLYLTSNTNVNGSLAQSTNSGSASEQIIRTLSPGRYLIRVEARFTGSCDPMDASGTGNRADYTLSVSP
ncbi:MAG: PPC domain-containing protein [Planctomycetota bacterium]